MVNIRVATASRQRYLVAMMNDSRHLDGIGHAGTILSQLSQLALKKLGQLQANKDAMSQLSQLSQLKITMTETENQ